MSNINQPPNKNTEVPEQLWQKARGLLARISREPISPTHLRAGKKVNGYYYAIGNESYLYDADTDTVYKYDFFPNTITEIIDDESIIREVKEKIKNDEIINNARREVAELLTSHEVTQEILMLHMEFTGGHVRGPTTKDGIMFYQVGHDLDQDSYIGYKDGQRYVYIVSDSDEPMPDDLDACYPPPKETIRPVDQFEGNVYIGNFYR